MKQLKLVDSLNSKEKVRHIKAVNWYCKKLAEKDLTLEKKGYIVKIQLPIKICQVR